MRENYPGARGFWGRFSEEQKDLNPVSGAKPFNSSWSVPPQCDYGTGAAFLCGFSQIKTE